MWFQARKQTEEQLFLACSPHPPALGSTANLLCDGGLHLLCAFVPYAVLVSLPVTCVVFSVKALVFVMACIVLLVVVWCAFLCYCLVHLLLWFFLQGRFLLHVPLIYCCFSGHCLFVCL